MYFSNTKFVHAGNFVSFVNYNFIRNAASSGGVTKLSSDGTIAAQSVLYSSTIRIFTVENRTVTFQQDISLGTDIFFACSLDFDGDVLAVALFTSADVSIVKTFKRTGTTWAADQTISPTYSPTGPDTSWDSVSVDLSDDGTWMGIGLPNHFHGTAGYGKAVTYENTSGSTWAFRQSFQNTEEDEGFGGRVSIGKVGSIFVVSTASRPGTEPGGGFYIYEGPLSLMTEQAHFGGGGGIVSCCGGLGFTSEDGSIVVGQRGPSYSNSVSSYTKNGSWAFAQSLGGSAPNIILGLTLSADGNSVFFFHSNEGQLWLWNGSVFVEDTSIDANVSKVDLSNGSIPLISYAGASLIRVQNREYREI